MNTLCHLELMQPQDTFPPHNLKCSNHVDNYHIIKISYINYTINKTSRLWSCIYTESITISAELLTVTTTGHAALSNVNCGTSSKYCVATEALNAILSTKVLVASAESGASLKSHGGASKGALTQGARSNTISYATYQRGASHCGWV